MTSGSARLALLFRRTDETFSKEGRALKELLDDWRNLVPAIGIAVVAAVGVFFMFRRKSEDPVEMERSRRAYLNRVGRIVEGQVVEIVDQGRLAGSANDGGKRAVALERTAAADGPRKLLYYTYAISGVTYET